MRFQVFADKADAIEDESKNTVMTTLISELFTNQDTDEELAISARFIQGDIFPSYSSRKISFGPSLMKRAIAKSTDLTEDEIEDKLPQYSDIGSIFDDHTVTNESGQMTLQPDNITIGEVYNVMVTVSEISGSGSQQKKVDNISSLLSRGSSLENKFITRLLLSEMRIGVGSGSVRDAIAQSFDVSVNSVERAMMLTNDVGEVAVMAKEGGESELNSVDVDIGNIPIDPMLAKKGDVSEVFDEMDSDELICEYKYDGFRIQVHKNGDTVKLYTRDLEDVTDSLPDIVEYVDKHIDTENVILDGEVVGYESDKFENPLTFQEIQQRLQRKYNIDEKQDEIVLKLHCFDCLYHQDTLLLDESLNTRWNILDLIADAKILADHSIVTTTRDIEKILQNANRENHEGGMVKNPQSTYEPNKRGKRWMKLKPEGETVDAVIVGGSWGKGNRKGTIASYKLAIKNESTGELEVIGRMGTGLTDDELDELTDHFEDRITSTDGREVTFKSDTIVEVKFEEVQESTKYDSGFALRFPKYIRKRETKDIPDTIERLTEIAEEL